MIIDGVEVIGLYNYELGYTYSEKDLIIVQGVSTFKLLRVLTQFDADDATSYVGNAGFYDEVSSSADDFGTPKLMRSSDLYSKVSSLAVLHKAGKTLNTIFTSINDYSINGLYKLTSTTIGLPVGFTPSSLSTLRISHLNDTTVIQEIIDVTSSSYYLRCITVSGTTFTGVNSDWINLIQGNNYEVVARANQLVNDVGLQVDVLSSLISNIGNTYRYTNAVVGVDYNATPTFIGFLTPGSYKIMFTASLVKYSIEYSTTDAVGTRYSVSNPIIKSNSASQISIQSGYTNLMILKLK